MVKALEIRCVTGFEEQAERFAEQERQAGNTVAAIKMVHSRNDIGGTCSVVVASVDYWQSYDEGCAWIAENLVRA